MLLIAYTSSRPGAIIEANCCKGLGQVLKYKVRPTLLPFMANADCHLSVRGQDMSLSLPRNNVEEGNILVLKVSTAFLKGKRNKKDPSVPATAPRL